MFLFNRERSGSTEVFSIYVAPGVLPDDTKRFERPLRVNERGQQYYAIGNLVFIHDPEQIEYFLFTNAALTDNEHNALTEQLELLAGRSVHALGSVRKQVWFHQDSLKSSPVAA